MSVHIGAKQGEIADKILLPGDPLRAKYIAENYLEDAKLYNEVRGMYGYTGPTKENVFLYREPAWECLLSPSM